MKLTNVLLIMLLATGVAIAEQKDIYVVSYVILEQGAPYPHSPQWRNAVEQFDSIDKLVAFMNHFDLEPDVKERSLIKRYATGVYKIGKKPENLTDKVIIRDVKKTVTERVWVIK